MELPEGAIDLGSGSWYTKNHDKDGTWIGIDEWHYTSAGDLCGGWVPFDVQSEWLAGGPKWTVESWDPLTLSPSLLCTRCQHHGFIRNGRWESC